MGVAQMTHYYRCTRTTCHVHDCAHKGVHEVTWCCDTDCTLHTKSRCVKVDVPDDSEPGGRVSR